MSLIEPGGALIAPVPALIKSSLALIAPVPALIANPSPNNKKSHHIK
ncbi:hypothetical protein ORD22_08300 [Sporosarcina sp. GW1-11]|nr:hypothetical protein [Sporosarcina sp. GW1-11]MDV6378248.1 hypothetical protein [Sporosarcina sp. GW1-11]